MGGTASSAQEKGATLAKGPPSPAPAWAARRPGDLMGPSPIGPSPLTLQQETEKVTQELKKPLKPLSFKPAFQNTKATEPMSDILNPNLPPQAGQKPEQTSQSSQPNFGLQTDFIVKQETGGKDYYNKALTRPSWPKAKSGVTIGVGYDLGYNTPDQIRKDWAGKLPPEQVERLVRASGVKGSNAQSIARELKDIQVPYEVAQQVFQEKTLPRFEQMTRETFGQGYEKLTPEQKTALVSTVFNRGASLKGDRRREMAEIKSALDQGNLQAVPGLFKSMKRLWKGQGVDGLLRRYDETADLFAAGNTFKDIQDTRQT